MRNVLARVTLVVTVALFLTASLGSAQQRFTIAKIEFEGLSRLSADEVMATIEVKIGQQFDLATLDAAAQKLIDSGMFRNVAYKTRATGNHITITFRVEETSLRNSRVIFDNFIWFSDAELVAAIQRDVPTFSGAAPDTGDTLERIRKSLERFLHENKIEAAVSHIASQDVPGSSTQEHVFSVSDIKLPICTLHFPGATSVSEDNLISNARELVGTEYSNKFVGLFAVNNLSKIYRELGHLKVAFAPALAKPESSAKCKSGVDVTIPVDEGKTYQWQKADWSGNTALTATELDTILDMQPAKPANGVKLDNAPRQIEKAYGRKGFIMARVRATPEFDDNAGTVAYKMELREGPQFRMGTLLPKGFPASEVKMLTSKWELKPGDIFNDDYAPEFTKKHMGNILRAISQQRNAEGRALPDVKLSNKVNREATTVDVLIELVN
ncbi:MAG TPA: POTRA domain-containing protein [Pyrinomonadaceae bacterium]|nr:POTRA domain-containing protein [Pyrinomonadaceae bacterium]